MVPPTERGDDGMGARRAGELAPSLEVQVVQGSVRLVLRIRNGGAKPVTLEFPTAQRFDFAVWSAGGAELWRWSSDRMFVQVCGTRTLGPGEAESYEAEWPSGSVRGRCEATAELAAANVRVEARAAFEL